MNAKTGSCAIYFRSALKCNCVASLVSSTCAFAALKDKGSVVTWGAANCGGDSRSVAHNLTGGVVCVQSSDGAFAALKETQGVTRCRGNTKMNPALQPDS